MADAELLSRLRSGLAELGRIDTIPERPFLAFARARIVSQGVDGRVSLQMVDRGAAEGLERPDTLPVPVWYGVPGVSAENTPGQELVLGFARGDGADPVAFLATPKGQPGHVPIRVRHEATAEILFVPTSAGVVRVGPDGTTVPVALGPALDALIAALDTFATACSTALSVAQVADAATTFKAALATIAPTSAARLEAI